jgi:hypothetical protein
LDRRLCFGFRCLLLLFDVLIGGVEVESHGFAELDDAGFEVAEGAFDEEALTLILVEEVVPEVVLWMGISMGTWAREVALPQITRP